MILRPTPRLHHLFTPTALAAAAIVAGCPRSALAGDPAPTSPPVKLDPATTRCLLAPGARDDLPFCFYRPSPTLEPRPAYLGYVALGVLVARNTMDLISRWDSLDLDVVTPVLAAALESPTGRWGISASLLVDVVSGPSVPSAVDLVTSASSPHVVRYAPAFGGHVRFGDLDVDLHGAVSDQSGDLFVSGGGGVALDLRRKTITPSLDYTFSYEIPGHLGATIALGSPDIARHTIEARTTFVLDEANLVAPSFTAVIEDGDPSRPYRHIPTFDPATATMVPAGATPELVNASRLRYDPFERLPNNRQRFALAGLVEHRFSWSTLRAEERLYLDGWGQKASTAFAQLLVDVGDRVRLWPEARAHAQTSVDFWRLAYVAIPSATGVSLPALRTGRLDLGPLVSVTGGAGVRVAFDEKQRFSLAVNGDVVYTRFLDHLYVIDKLGFAGATMLEARLR